MNHIVVAVFLALLLLGCSSPHSSTPDVEAYYTPAESDSPGWCSPPDHATVRIYDPSVLPLERGQIREPLCFRCTSSGENEKGHPLLVFIVDAPGGMLQKGKTDENSSPVSSILRYIVEQLPLEVTVGLVRHGAKDPADCTDMEFLVQPDCNAKGALFSKLDTAATGKRVSVAGAVSLVSKTKAQQQAGGNDTIIFLLSDGQQSCNDQNACEQVHKLKTARDNFVLNVIGFAHDARQRTQLQCLAEAGGGKYMAAEDRDILSLSLTLLAKKIKQQVQWSPVPCLTINVPETDRDDLQFLGQYTHAWYADQQSWSKAIMKSLKNEVQARHCSVGPGGRKLLKVQITSSRLSWETRQIRCRIDMTVQTGDDAVYTFTESYTDTDLYGSCDGAVREVTAAVLNSEDIRQYLRN